MASTLTVRLFELLCLTLFIAGLLWVRRTGHPVYAGVYLGSPLLFGFDSIFNSNWLFRVEFDSKFIYVSPIQGASEPLAMALNYAPKPGYLLGGVPWSNIWYSGLLTVTCYMGARLAVRWASPARIPAPVGA